MDISRIRTLIPVVLLLSVVKGDWEVLNEVNEVDKDELNLQEENLILAESSFINKDQGARRSLAFHDQSKRDQQIARADIKTRVVLPDPGHLVAKTVSTSDTISKKQVQTTSNSVYSSHDQVLRKTKKNDDSEIISEGFILIQNRQEGHSRRSRKLTQFTELSSQDVQQNNKNINLLNVHIVPQEASITNITANTQLPRTLSDTSEQKQLELSRQLHKVSEIQQMPSHENTGVQLATVSNNDYEDFMLTFKLACVEVDSLECLRFKEDYTAMKNSFNESSRMSAKERLKRQASSNIGNTGNSRNYQQIIGCENNDCFSGNGTDFDEEEVVPEFRFKSTTKIATNLTSAELEHQRAGIARKMEDELRVIFKDVPGFKNVSVNPAKIYVTSEGVLVTPFEVTIDGGDPIFTGMNGKDVRDQIAEPLKQAGNAYKNITLNGNHPLNDFNYTAAADQVEEEAKDPCKISPSVCPKGYSSCTRLPNRGNGIEVKCTSSCKTYGPCQINGICVTDMTGSAYCLCSENWIGLYCDRQNETSSPQDVQTSPEFYFKSSTTFNTTFTPSNLTSEKRAEIARNMTEQLNNIFHNLPGFKNLKVDPNSLTIKDGQLAIDWEVTVDLQSYTGKTPNQIVDSLRANLKNVSKAYRHSVTIENQVPLTDFDYVDAADQIESQALDPCNTDPCPSGYVNCRALHPASIKCIHNCNAIDLCQNSGTCQLKQGGEATCQCTKGWSGNNCKDKVEQLDAGEIAGIVLGSLLIVAGALGCIFWFLCCRRSQRDVKFTTYTDEEQSESYTASSLFNIQRPHISVDPFPIFRPSSNVWSGSLPAFSQSSNPRNISRRPSLGKAINTQEPSRYSNAQFRIS